MAGPYVVTAGADAAGYFTDVVNLSNGKLVWSGGECYSNGAVLPVVVGQQVISYGCDKHSNAAMQAFNLASGKMAWSLSRWTFQSGDLSGATGKHLYAKSPTGTVDGLNPLTGKVEYPLKRAVTVLAVDLSRVYATCGSGGKFVCAYNISTGAQEWQIESDGELVNPESGKCLADPGSATGTQLQLSTCSATGSQEWKLPS